MRVSGTHSHRHQQQAQEQSLRHSTAVVQRVRRKLDVVVGEAEGVVVGEAEGVVVGEVEGVVGDLHPKPGLVTMTSRIRKDLYRRIRPSSKPSRCIARWYQ